MGSTQNNTNINLMVESTKYRIALIGATGAIGREIVHHIKTDTRFSEVILLCRKPLEEWKP